MAVAPPPQHPPNDAPGVSIEDLYTIVAEVESRVNNRPLTYVSDDIDELEALTPSHLICGRRLKLVPSVTHTLDQDDPSYLDHEELNERYSNLSKIINKWQDLWKREYLTSLREKFYGMSPSQDLKRTLKTGNIVIVQGLGPRAEWPLGRVEETYADVEGAVRMVKVQTKTRTVLRTVEKLFPLECEVDTKFPLRVVLPQRMPSASKRMKGGFLARLLSSSVIDLGI